MAVLRATGIVLALMLTLLVGAPLQLVFGRRPTWRFVLPRLFCRVSLALLGVRLVETSPRPAGPARLLVANHVSWLDVLVLGSLEPVSFLAKSEVAGWPVFGTLARLNGTVFIDRARRRSIPGANRAMAARLAAGGSVLLFPEGTTYDGTRRGRFLTSHLACLRDLAATGVDRAAVQPVALRYSHADAAWVGAATLLPHIWTVLRTGGVQCDVSYGKRVPVPPGYDRKALGRRLAAEIDELLQTEGAAIPTTGAAAEARWVPRSA